MNKNNQSDMRHPFGKVSKWVICGVVCCSLLSKKYGSIYEAHLHLGVVYLYSAVSQSM